MQEGPLGLVWRGLGCFFKKDLKLHPRTTPTPPTDPRFSLCPWLVLEALAKRFTKGVPPEGRHTAQRSQTQPVGSREEQWAHPRNI